MRTHQCEAIVTLLSDPFPADAQRTGLPSEKINALQNREHVHGLRVSPSKIKNKSVTVARGTMTGSAKRQRNM